MRESDERDRERKRKTGGDPEEMKARCRQQKPPMLNLGEARRKVLAIAIHSSPLPDPWQRSPGDRALCSAAASGLAQWPREFL